MRVLFITSRFPQSLRRGDEQRAYQHLRELAQRHEITLLAFAPDDEESAVTAEIRRLCKRVVTVQQSAGGRWIRALRALPGSVPLQAAMNDTRTFREALTELLHTSTFDVAHVLLARLGEMLPLLGSLPCVLDLVDALSVNMARRAHYDAGPIRLIARFEAARLLPYERRLCAQVAAAAISSARDRDALGGDLSTLHVVANGIDPDEFAFSTQAREPDRLIFSGNLGYFPNVDAAVWFVRDVFPRVRAQHPKVELHLVGARPAIVLRRLAQAQPGVRLIGPVENMQLHLSRAAVALAPMRAGSGQQIKILEAMGCGAPVVATSQATGGLEAVPGRHLLVADDGQTFADAVSRLLYDRAFADELARNARTLVEQHYTCKGSAESIEMLWQAAVIGDQTLRKVSPWPKKCDLDLI